MKLFRCIGAAGLISLMALATSGAAPALADGAPAVSITSPTAGGQKNGPFTISGSAQQSGSQARIASIKVHLSSDDGWPTPADQNYTGTAGGVFSGGGANVSFNWTNVSVQYNGPYTVTVTAVGQYDTTLGGTQTQQAVVSNSFTVEVTPSTPTGVTATKPDGSNAVTVKWNANPEPDIAYYQILRSYAGSTGKQQGVVDGTKTTFIDDLTGAPPGQYRYAVQAFRHQRSCKGSNVDAACGNGIASAVSAYSSPVTVQGAPPTTTTTTKGSSGGSSSGGSSSGGSSSGGSSGSGSSSSGSSSSGTNKNAAGYKTGTGGVGFAPGGNVDLSQFGNLLNPKAKTSGNGEDNIPEGTYDPTLPYGEQPVAKPKHDNTLISIGGADIPAPSDDWVKFIGLGSLVTAVLVHVLWFKQQVDRLPLEAID